MRKTICVFSMCAAAVLAGPAARAQDAGAQNPSQAARPKAIDYSDGYLRRAKIHKYASFATLPLFATELALGQSIYNDPNARTSAARNAHIVVGTSIIGLFAVNTVTGLWNMPESRRVDPNHRTLRLLHGLLMLGADAGFVATSATGPGGHERRNVNFDTNKHMHRTIALTSIGLATGSYLMMLFGNR